MMKISFIIPVYNCEPYLPDCVSGIRAVGAEDFEIILVDDGSTDGSGAVCDALAAQHPEIRVIHQVNAGASAARNRGIREAMGCNILFLDADDGIDPDALREVLADPRCDQSDLTIFGMTFDYYKKGKCYRRDPLFFEAGGILPRHQWGDAFAELYAKNALSPVWNKVFKRDILLRNNLEFNKSMFLYEDFEFVLRYMQHCDQIWNVPKAIYHYRQSEDEGNAKRRLARIDSIPVFLEPIEAALAGLKNANPAISQDAENRVLQQLYLCLAREKISTSRWDGIRQICREFVQWSEKRNLPLEPSEFQRNLMEEKALHLLLADKKSALRHKAAVWVKSRLYKV